MRDVVLIELTTEIPAPRYIFELEAHEVKGLGLLSHSLYSSKSLPNLLAQIGTF